MSSMWMVDGDQLSATAAQPSGCILAQNKQGADEVQRYKRLVFIEFLNILSKQATEK
ncbi:uncharacterized protein FFB20_10011 [Fusarium fujikuroi]|nr:uncharacterized protein FPRN_04664 [Fusarium proliferatum]SCN77553.1 uncharacterized protein FFE2_03873 [Fusarium fujikuroi]SCN79806.1 uncharacterized protein FFM5_02208 [Fusarium fujikuroi]SCN95504.1 uncharacterized protein FFB20_10011 [Fusarium fujikuroi]SCN95968.1 uncharacterized protein FFC1_07455 [Fusarium fujikuroi]